jgi:WS/DGAT/MGAT family acyltransferase
VLRALPTAIPNLEETQFAAIPGAATVGRLAGRLEAAVSGDGRVVRSGLEAPKTAFSGRISAHRRFAFGRLDLDRVKAVKSAYGVTVNDVVVTMCAGAVRRWLIEHDQLPSQPLVTQIPVSVRTSEQQGTYGNRILLLGAPLFTDIADPAERLQATHRELSVMKDRHKAMPAQLLQDVNHFVPPALFSRAARATFGLATSSLGRPQWNLVVSNVPGPQFPLYCAGARLVAHYPVSVITDGMGLNITAMSYDGHIDVGVIADRDQIPDVWCLVEWLEEALVELEKEAPASS